MGLPEKFTVSGSCNFLLNGEVSQKMEVKFYEDWILTIYFTDSENKTDVQNQLTADSSDKYYISQIELEYEYNSNLFVKADESSKLKHFRLLVFWLMLDWPVRCEIAVQDLSVYHCTRLVAVNQLLFVLNLFHDLNLINLFMATNVHDQTLSRPVLL